MALSEPDRQELYRSLERAIGKKSTETLMNIASNVPWTEVATKTDLARLGDQLRAEFHKGLRGQLLAFTTILAVFNGMTFAALQLT